MRTRHGPTVDTLAKPVDAQATVTDQRNNTWKFRTDRFGGITESITALGYILSVSRNADGLPYVSIEPDPDGAGALTSSVTYIGYNGSDDLTHLIAPDGDTTTLIYSSTLHRLHSSTDRVGRTTSTTYDANENTFTRIDVVGPLAAPVPGLAYDSNERLVTVTNPDTSTRTMTYNSADQVLTSVDEFGKTSIYVFGSLGPFKCFAIDGLAVYDLVDLIAGRM